MIETLISGMILAALTGITAMAYKYPQSYSLILKKVYLFGAACQVIFLSYVIGTALAVYKLTEFIDPAKKEEAQAAAHALYPPSFWWLILPTAIMLYLLFLTSLPYLFNDENEKGDNQKVKPND